MDIEKLISDLQRDEGWRPYLYNDANGSKIVPGYTVRGHPTLAWGFALDVSPFTQSEAMPVLESRARDKWREVCIAIPWIESAPEPVQRGIANMAYNMGTTTLLKFNVFLSLLQQEKYEEAADDLATTLWFRQVGNRAIRIQELIRSGANE